MVRSCSRLSAYRCWALSQAMYHLTAMLMSSPVPGSAGVGGVIYWPVTAMFHEFEDSSSRYCRKEECIGATSWFKYRTATAIPTLFVGLGLAVLELAAGRAAAGDNFVKRSV